MQSADVLHFPAYEGSSRRETRCWPSSQGLGHGPSAILAGVFLVPPGMDTLAFELAETYVMTLRLRQYVSSATTLIRR